LAIRSVHVIVAAMDGKHRVIGLGEVLWDVFPDGPRFGGAPANFACHAAQCGADVFVVSRVGEDELGEEAISFLSRQGVHTSAITRARDLPTGAVQVELDEAGSPRYEIAAPVAWDAIEWSAGVADLAATANAVCFGTLAQRSNPSRGTILDFLRATPDEALRVFDVNLRQSFYSAETIRASLRLCNVLKLNDVELPIVAEACGASGWSPEVQMRVLCERYALRLAAMTRGPEGAVIVAPAQVSQCAGFRTQVRDSVGAGDAYTAVLTIGLLAGWELDAINEHACRVAAYACSQPGATPRLPDELRGFAGT
jgi:fructokinase